MASTGEKIGYTIAIVIFLFLISAIGYCIIPLCRLVLRLIR